MDLPEYFSLMPDVAAAKYLTHSVLSGGEQPPKVALLRVGQTVDPPAARWRVAPVRQLLNEARRRYEDDRAAADSWLAPRLHATMRMTRREAANSGLWNFLALVVAPDYVLWRHKGFTKEGERATADRFVGVHYKQTFARLWWAAEMFRDGDDYEPAVLACKVQDVLNTVLRYEIIDHRPTARAVVRLLERGLVRTGRDVNGLGTAINAAGSTLLYDVLAPDDGPDAEARRYWIAEAENAGPIPMDSLPDGPDDGRIPRTSVDVLVQRFEELFAEAPVRGKEPSGEVPLPRMGVSLDKPYSPF
ncbi:hypothetical protein STRIP9103_03416 [Streptomyces ipomoeae 91-03]|uniref:Uncharacterized protein n=2 Tax=Streptomyces ipomoeae TaxID=103232 RepID=L1KYR8_9ACTN|nr:hypothetical protein STRIP9103_03416 [Streptomyces ipomoeae 91-03]